MSKTQQVQNQQRFVREESRQMLPGANDHPSNPNFGGPLHDLAQQCIGTLPILQWSQIIRLVEVYRADTRGIHKVKNIDGLRRFDVGLDEIIICERDVLSLFVFVTLDNFTPRYFPACFLIHSSIPNPREIAPIEQVEIYRPIGFSRIEGDRDIDQSEINGALPNRAASGFRLGRCSSLLVSRFFTWHGFLQLLNGFLVDRGAGFVAAVLYLDRTAACGFRVTRAANPTSSLVSSPSRHGSSCRHLFLSGNKITHQREYPEPDREFANMRWTGQRATLAGILINVSRPKPKRLIFAPPGNGGTRDFFEGFTEQFVLSGVHRQIAEGYDADKMLFAIQNR